MQSVLDGVSLGAAHRVKGHNPAVVEGDYGLEKEVCVAAGQVLVMMHVTDWAKAQREDPVLNAVLGLPGSPKEDRPEDTLGRACC